MDNKKATHRGVACLALSGQSLFYVVKTASNRLIIRIKSNYIPCLPEMQYLLQNNLK